MRKIQRHRHPHPTQRLTSLVLLLLALLLIGQPAQALPPVPFVVTTASLDSNITLYTDLLEDDSNSLSFKDVLLHANDLAFQSANSNLERLGFSDKTWWIRFSLLNKSDVPLRLVLRLAPIQVAQITFFHPDDKGGYAKSFAGSEYLQPWGDIRYHYPLFRLTLPPGQVQTYYLRILPKQSFNYAVYLNDPATLTHTLSHNDLLLLGCTGLLFGLLCLNLGFFWRQRDISYLFYAVFLLFITLACLTNTGIIGIEYLPLPGLQPRLESFAICLAVVFTCLFTLTFLSLHQQRNACSYMIVILGLLASLGALTCWMAPATLSLQLSYSLILLAALLLAAVGLRCLFLKLHHAPLYLLARLPLLLTSTVAMLAQYNLVPMEISLNLPILIATSIEALIFALGLSQKNFDQMVTQLEYQHRHAMQLQEHNTRKQVLTQLGHEIRTPMNGILGMTSLLGDTSLSHAQRECVATIQDASNSLLHIVNNIFEIAREHEGTKDSQRDRFDINQTAANLVRLLHEKTREKHIELISYVHTSVPNRVIGNAGKVQQCLANLLSACIYKGQAGDLLFEITLDPRGSSDMLQFRIEGSALPTSADWTALMDRPAKDAYQDRASINLALAQQLLDDLQGSFGHSGASPWIRLPLPADDSTPEERASNLQRLQGRTLMLLSNSQALTRILYRQTLAWGMSATVSNQPLEALSSLRLQAGLNEPYDITIFDHDMHDMDGLQFASKIRQDSSLDKSMVLIMLSDDRHLAEQHQPGQHGIQRILLKPVLGDQLQQVLMHEMEVLQPLLIGRSGEPDDLQLLVAEDHALSQKVIRTMLEKLGAKVDMVGNGVDAVAAVQRKHYDLVFMDCEMPEMDGFEATRQIRAWEKTRGSSPLPIIALTAHVLNFHKEHALASGMNAHLGKPVELKQLRDVLTRFLAAHQDKPLTERPDIHRL